MNIDKKLLNEIIKAIEWDIIPDEDYHFEEGEGFFESDSYTYISNGTLKYNGEIYEFGWNREFGIIYDTIELKKEE